MLVAVDEGPAERVRISRIRVSTIFGSRHMRARRLWAICVP